MKYNGKVDVPADVVEVFSKVDWSVSADPDTSADDFAQGFVTNALSETCFMNLVKVLVARYNDGDIEGSQDVLPMCADIVKQLTGNEPLTRREALLMTTVEVLSVRRLRSLGLISC